MNAEYAIALRSAGKLLVTNSWRQNARGTRSDHEWHVQYGMRQGGEGCGSSARATGRNGRLKYRMRFGELAGGVRARKNSF